MVRRSVKDHKNLIWLTESPAIQLTEETYLIGHDGWVDGRAGIGQRSGLLLNDYRAIADFRDLPTTNAVYEQMRKRADAATRRLTQQIRKKGLGIALTKVVEETGARLTILCGHTHGETNVTINDNIIVRVGWAQYYNPRFTTIDVGLGY